MTNNQMLPLFGSGSHQPSQKFGGALSRVAKREAELAAARAEVAAVREQAEAFVAMTAMTNVATLTSHASSLMTVAPEAKEYYELLIAGYALGAGQRVARGL